MNLPIPIQEQRTAPSSAPPTRKGTRSRAQLSSSQIYLPDKPPLLSMWGWAVTEGKHLLGGRRPPPQHHVARGRCTWGSDPELIAIYSAAPFVSLVALYWLRSHSCDEKSFHHSGLDTKTPGFEKWKILSEDCEGSLKIETLKAPERKVR